MRDFIIKQCIKWSKKLQERKVIDFYKNNKDVVLLDTDPAYSSTYWYISDYGVVTGDIWGYTGLDLRRRDFKNVFILKEEASEELRALNKWKYGR